MSEQDPTFDVQEHVSADSTLLMLRGELDILAAPLLDACVRDLRPLRAPLTLDVGDLTFVDSSGLRSLTAARLAAVEDLGGGVTLRNARKPLLKLLDLTGLASAFEVG